VRAIRVRHGFCAKLRTTSPRGRRAVDILGVPHTFAVETRPHSHAKLPSVREDCLASSVCRWGARPFPRKARFVVVWAAAWEGAKKHAISGDAAHGQELGTRVYTVTPSCPIDGLVGGVPPGAHRFTNGAGVGMLFGHFRTRPYTCARRALPCTDRTARIRRDLVNGSYTQGEHIRHPGRIPGRSS
jgi:hypothetical protein